MITQQRRFLYQPYPLGSIINWSWTLIIFLLGVIFWLEVTHFNWMTLAFFVVFALLSWIEIHFRNITMADGMLTVSRVLNHHHLVIPLADVKGVRVARFRLGIVAQGRIYQFLLPQNSVIELAALIRAAMPEQVEREDD